MSLGSYPQAVGNASGLIQVVEIQLHIDAGWRSHFPHWLAVRSQSHLPEAVCSAWLVASFLQIQCQQWQVESFSVNLWPLPPPHGCNGSSAFLFWFTLGPTIQARIIYLKVSRCAILTLSAKSLLPCDTTFTSTEVLLPRGKDHGAQIPAYHTLWPSNASLCCFLPRVTKMYVHTKTWIEIFTAALSVIAKTWLFICKSQNSVPDVHQQVSR